MQPEYNETYTFTTLADDGAQLWVNGQLLISDWTSTGATQSNSASITLKAQQIYNVEMEYYYPSERKCRGAIAMVESLDGAGDHTAIAALSLYQSTADRCSIQSGHRLDLHRRRLRLHDGHRRCALQSPGFRELLHQRLPGRFGQQRSLFHHRHGHPCRQLHPDRHRHRRQRSHGHFRTRRHHSCGRHRRGLRPDGSPAGSGVLQHARHLHQRSDPNIALPDRSLQQHPGHDPDQRPDSLHSQHPALVRQRVEGSLHVRAQ